MQAVRDGTETGEVPWASVLAILHRASLPITRHIWLITNPVGSFKIFPESDHSLHPHCTPHLSHHHLAPRSVLEPPECSPCFHTRHVPSSRSLHLQFPLPGSSSLRRTWCPLSTSFRCLFNATLLVKPSDTQPPMN